MMSQQKNIALVAHDGKKKALLDWANEHKSILKNHLLYATGSTGKLLEAELDLPIHKLESGPLGGDQQLGAGIVNGEIDALIFFWDPLEAQPHDPDIRALLRIAVVWNIPVACSEVTASIIIRSDFMDKPFKHRTPDYSEYRRRPLRK